ncbi:MAG: hypothetical protein Kow0091_18800 [Geminocystis sp.]
MSPSTTITDSAIYSEAKRKINKIPNKLLKTTDFVIVDTNPKSVYLTTERYKPDNPKNNNLIAI